ncbi:MAG: sortase [Oscillospiraceae bacterium]|nr:sortase [Oscillospiraceae bacterium]
MKKIIRIIATFILLSQLSISTFAYNYTFSSGPDSKTKFDKSTQSDEITATNQNENVRSNKDVAYSPPPYGIFSGDIPTDLSSLYHTPDKSSTATTSNVTYSSYTSSANDSTTANLPDTPTISNEETSASTSVYSDTPVQILPIYYSDGSIGTLEFPRFGKTIKVYEGETLENMLLGAGHFSSTSTWDGNCAIAAHNRGVENNFGFLADINIGDKVVYTTKYGVRTYKVTEKTQIAETDTSGLAWSEKNILSLYTCVQNVAGMRIYVRCEEVV